MTKAYLISQMFLAATAGLVNAGEAVAVDKGQYLIGSDSPKALKNERPRHTVALTAYSIDKRPVSIKEFVNFLDTLLQREDGKVSCPPNNQGILGQLEPPQEIKRLIRVPSYWLTLTEDGFILNGLNGAEPVFNASWEGADAYCRSAGKSLPTEAQWETACADSSKELVVSSKEEWTADWYTADYYRRAPAANPLNDTNTGLKSVRGGADKRGKINCSSRSGSKPGTAVMNRTFRCVEQLSRE